MARKKIDFKPDRVQRDVLGKLLLTRKQRQSLLKWALFSLVCLLGLLIQDVILSRVTILDTTTELVPCFILVICVLQGAQSGCVFALSAACLYYFSGSAPGIYCIPILTALAVVAAIFRQAFLRKGFSALLLCVAVSMVLYELAVFGIGLFLGRTLVERLGAFCLTAVFSVVTVPLLYPIVLAIGKIGGETWKE